MLCDINNGRVDCIIVKDLSRFGRNFIETSEYLEKIFPRKVENLWQSQKYMENGGKEIMSDEKQLRQAKKRDKKVYITDIAIEKVPYVKYKGMDEEQNKIMQTLAQLVLQIAKTENDSNEVAITWDMASRGPLCYGIDRGNEERVRLGGSATSYHLLSSGEKVALVLLHNHPSTRTFSLEDIYLLLGLDNVNYMVVVSNQGQIHYIKREEDFNAENAGMMYNRIRSEGKRQGISVYQMSLTFLKRCNEVGLFYR